MIAHRTSSLKYFHGEVIDMASWVSVSKQVEKKQITNCQNYARITYPSPRSLVGQNTPYSLQVSHKKFAFFSFKSLLFNWRQRIWAARSWGTIP